MIVGEVAGEEDEHKNAPFSGASGFELRKMLSEAKLDMDSAFVTLAYRRRSSNPEKLYTKNTNAHRIPSHDLSLHLELLYEEIELVRPKVIIALGDMVLWALTNNRGITKWRGSQLVYSSGDFSCTVIPTYTPASIFVRWDWRSIMVLDLKRAARLLHQEKIVTPDWDFTIRPSFTTVINYLNDYLRKLEAGVLWLGGDLETRDSHIACFGITDDPQYLKSICIPFMCTENSKGYWTLEEESEIVYIITKLFRHHNSQWVFQNGLYDYQYFARYWHCTPRLGMDTMLTHHTLWAGLPKGLDFQSSLYCSYHKYWKGEGKTWNPNQPEEQLWEYNCKDCVSMVEIADNLRNSTEQLHQKTQVAFQHRQFHAVLDMMLRGVRTNAAARAELSKELERYQIKINEWFVQVLGHSINVASPKQMQALFYEDLNQKIIRKKRKKNVYTPTLDDDALKLIGVRQPLLLPLIRNITRLRSINVFKSTFVDMLTDTDGRLRTSYNIAGTETFRYNSSQNAFGSGGNLQNVPEGDDPDEPNPFPLPNVRKLFLPDPGYTWADWDLDRADVQVVAWEANDDMLKQMLREGVNLHNENAKDIFGRYPASSHDPIYKQAKIGVHATNYGVHAPTLARTLGLTIHEAERFISRWFQVHPGIADWHDRVSDSLNCNRCVTNAFGFRRYYFDRIAGLLPEALAWIPQSTVALVIDMGLVNVYENLPKVQNLLQVHDSIGMQYKTDEQEIWLPKIKEQLLIKVPYDDPLIIPIGAKISTKSWGDCEDISV